MGSTPYQAINSIYSLSDVSYTAHYVLCLYMYTRAHTQVCHIPTDQVMVLKLNKRMTGMKKLKEVELLKKLHHPNILRYYGACVHSGQLHPLTEVGIYYVATSLAGVWKI
jgi:serine/threonine protein kinase